jgi:glycosyltransferase involved in cell wall biosynthesis
MYISLEIKAPTRITLDNNVKTHGSVLPQCAPSQPERKVVTGSLHICVVSETLPPDVNGVAMTIGRIISGLRQRDHKIDLVYPERMHYSGLRRTSGVCGNDDVIVRGFPVPFYKAMSFGVSGKGVFVKKWRSKRPDIVHIVTEGPLGVAALLAARQLQIPIVSGFHTNFHQYAGHYRVGALQPLVMRYLRWFHNRCKVTLVPTNAMVNELNGFGINNVRVLSRGVDTTLFSPERRSDELRRTFGAAENDPVLLYVGRVAAEKNIPLAIEAFERFQSVVPAAKLVIVGDGPMLEKIRSHPARPIICGSKQGQELAAHYASADIFLFPSLSETFGNVTLEAMASELAVVAFNDAAAKEFICHQHNGMLASQNTDAAYLEAVESLARQPLCIRDMRRQARDAVARCGWSDVCDTLIDVYCDTLSR